MRVLISPAKKMRVDTDSFAAEDLPAFLDRAEILADRLREMTYPELKALWKCSDQIAQRSLEQLQAMDLRKGLTPALISYEGIQYRYMAPGVFTTEELAYVREHLRILSGFLRPSAALRWGSTLPSGDAGKAFYLRSKRPLRLLGHNNCKKRTVRNWLHFKPSFKRI